MKKTKYQIEFVRRFLKDERHITLLSPEYIGSHISLRCHCDVCNHEWDAQFSNLKFGQGCPKCGKIKAANKHRVSTKKIHSLFLSKNIIPLNLEKYQTAKTPLLCKCKKCGYEWLTNYSRIVLENKGCPNCKRYVLSLKNTLPLETVTKRLEATGIILKSPYISATTPIKCECKKCGYEWMSSGFANIINCQSSCQNCNHLSFLSEKICRIVMENIFERKFMKYFIPAVGVGGRKLELDGYNNDIQVAFEHNGPQHYSPKWYGKSSKDLTKKFQIQCRNDQIKHEWCKSNGITLIILRELGRYTTEKNIVSTIKNQLLKTTLPDKIDTYVPNFGDIKNHIITMCSTESK